VSAWLGTIATSALRTLDLTLMLDLLRIEEEDDRWGDLMTPLVALLDDLLLVGDFDAALALIAALVREANGTGTKVRRQHAITAIDLLIAGSMMRHVSTHLATIDEAQFERTMRQFLSSPDDAPEAADPLTGLDTLSLHPQVLFRHPLIRSAVYDGADPDSRRIVHLALRDEADLRTESEGEGMRRCLVVYPKDYKSAAKPAPRSTMPRAAPVSNVMSGVLRFI